MTTIVVGVLLAAGGARSDEITVKGLPYTNVRVTDVDGCKVYFRASTGNPAKVPLADVDTLTVMGRADLNKAEQLMREEKAAEAVKSYDAAMRFSDQPWMKKLVRHRRLRALEQAGQIDRAAEDWLTIVANNQSSPEAIALRPRKVGQKGSDVNRQAIDLLKLRLQRGPKETFRTAMQDLLLELYRVEGRDEEAVALAKQLNETVFLTTESERKTPAVSGKAFQQQLQRAEFLIAKGHADTALREIEERLKSYRREDLPKALLLLGKARLALAEDDADLTKQRMQLLKAGLDFMRVAVFFPESDESPEALFLAAGVNASIGNVQAGGKAYRLVIREYERTPFAPKARDELKKLSPK